MNAKYAVILAAGKGQRLDHLDCPKPLVKVGNQPMILWNIKQLQEAGIKNIYIVAGYRGEEIKKELTNHPGISANLNYIEQNDSSKAGMLKSVIAVKDYINEPFFLLAADVIIEKNPYLQFADFSSANDKSVITALIGANKEQFNRSGALSQVVIEKENIISVGRDLPHYNGLQTGVYYFNKGSIDMLNTANQTGAEVKDFDELLNQVAGQNKFKAVILEKGEWFDVNTPATYIRAEMFVRNQNQAAINFDVAIKTKPLASYANFQRQKNMHSEIIIMRDLINQLPQSQFIPAASLEAPHFILTDNIVDNLYGRQLLDNFKQAGYNMQKLVIEAGEHSKNINEYAKLADEIFNYGMNKQSIIISLGGGVVNNIAGFLASTLYRGIGLIHIPTSMMAQVDAAIDFKQAVNSIKGKNLMGSYYPASKIIIDPNFLLTLDRNYINDGIAESIKHALLQDSNFLDFLDNNYSRIQEIDFLDKVVRETVKLKVPLLNGDVEDDRNEMLPQYGHSMGHAVEHLSSYKFLHGESIAIGMCVCAEISKLLDICNTEVVKKHYDICNKYDLPTKVPDYINAEDIINIIKYDKHHVAGNSHMALVEKIGKVWQDKGVYGVPIDYEIIKKAVINNKNR